MTSSDLQPGQIVVVPFPYADQLAEKRRPALVISNQQFTKTHELIWVAMITSAKNAGWADDIALPLHATGLTAPSIIRTAKLATLEAARIIRVAGKVPDDVLATALKQVHGNLAMVAA